MKNHIASAMSQEKFHNFHSVEKAKTSQHSFASPGKKTFQCTSYIFSFLLSCFISRTYILGNYSPFAPALVASIPFNNMWTTVSGCCIGYFLPPYSSNSMHYISIVLSIATIRWTLNDLSRLKKHFLFAPLIAFAPTLITGITVNTIDGFSSSALIGSIAESLLSAITAYFFNTTFSISKQSLTSRSITTHTFACIILSYCVISLSFSHLIIFNVSIGQILAILAILISAYTASVFGGAITGATSGIILSLSSPNSLYLASLYSFGGIMSGLFSCFGKNAVAAAFILSNFVTALQAPQITTIISKLYETSVATFIFMLIPQRFFSLISNLFITSNNLSFNEGLKKNILVRLKFMGKTLCNVMDSVDAVSHKMENITKQDPCTIFSKTINSVCKKCALQTLCLDKNWTSTHAEFEACSSKLLLNEDYSFSPDFSKTCKQLQTIKSSLISNCNNFKINQLASRRVGDLRNIVTSQFSGMGEILSTMADEFEFFECFDMEAASKISDILNSIGIVTIDAICRIDKLGRMRFELQTGYVNQKTFHLAKLPDRLNKIFGRTFAKASVTPAHNSCRIQICEKPKYTVEIGNAQHTCNNGMLCGDSFSFFDDGAGRMIAIISDGMGTGGRAAVDGAMASDIMTRLAKSGMSFESAIKIVNSAIFIKSSDESSATLDIVCLDLFTGEIELLKAGAPLTLIKKGNQITRFDSPSLPVGILSEVQLSHQKTTLTENDLVLMFSDGAISSDENILENSLKIYSNDLTCEEFADNVLCSLLARQTPEKDDDITILAIKLVSN